MKNNTKKYFAEEKEVLKKLGLTPCKGSGNTWVEKEDGYNQHILTQLKGTNSNRLTIKLEDWQKLEYNARLQSKIPVFVNHKYATEGQEGIILITVRPEHLGLLDQYLQDMEINKYPSMQQPIQTNVREDENPVVPTGGRQKYWNNKYKKA